MEIIDPTYGKPGARRGKAAAPEPDWRRDPMCLFSNSKPNADELLRGIGARLGAALGRGDISFESKENAAMPADPDQLDWLARQYRVVLLAAGD